MPAARGRVHPAVTYEHAREITEHDLARALDPEPAARAVTRDHHRPCAPASVALGSALTCASAPQMAKIDRRALLLTGDIGVAMRSLALPMVVGIIFILLVDVVDTYYVGQLGTDELAAMSFAFPVISVVVNVAMGFSVGATSAVSRAIGGGDERAARRLTSHALYLAFAVVGLISTFGILTQTALFRLLGAPPELIPLLERFMTIWYAGAVFLVVPMVGNGVQRASGDTRTPALIMMIAAVLNLVLDPLLIFGAGPIPAMGLEGAAYATVLARSVTLVITLIILRRMDLLDLSRPSWRELFTSWRQVLAVGGPAALTNLMVPVAAGVMTALIARQGAEAVAGYGVATRLEGLLLMAPLAVSAAMTPLIGQNWGANNLDRVLAALRLAQRFVVAWGLGVWVFLALLGGPVIMIFTEDPAVSAAARAYFWIVPLAYGSHGLVSIAGATFNAVDRARTSTALSALRSLGLAIPLAWIGQYFFELSGIYSGIAAASVLTGLLSLRWLRSLARPPPPLPTNAAT
jgi:putative MATE family efflux protein